MNEPLLQQFNGADLVRIIFLSTYLYKDGYLKTDNFKYLMTISQMKDLLKLSKSEYNRFIKEMKENNIIKFDSIGIILNNNYFLNGKIINKRMDKSFIRVYVDAVQELYFNTKVNQQKKLSIIFRLIPYISLVSNVVCRNPEEKDANLIQNISIKEFAEIAGYDLHNISKLKNDLLSIRCQGEYCVLFLTGSDFCNASIIVNPRICSRMYSDTMLKFWNNNFARIKK